MKRLLLNLLCLMVVAWANAQQMATITGTVVNLTGSPVANHDVYAYSNDSLLYTYGDALTDANGVYSITLPIPNGLTTITVGTLDGCGDPWHQVEHQVTVSNGALPPINFEICDPQNSCFAIIEFQQDSGLTVHFTSIYFGADSSAYGLTYNWDFGDGTTGSGANPVHTYATDGVYTITLVVTGSDGCTATTSATVFLNNNPGNYCDVSIQINPVDSLTFGFSGTLFAFDSTAILTYSWDFGDGTSSTDPQPVHTYATGGFYIVTLTVITSSGCVATTELQFSTDFPPFPNCDAFIDYNQTDTSTFSFYAFAYGMNGDSTQLMSYTWDFGDGTTGTGPNPTHTYAQPGLYTVQLVGITADSCVIHACIVVCNFNTPVDTFTYGCQALFSVQVYPDSSGNYLTTGFYDWSVGGVQAWQWNFGDSTFSNQQNPVHTYQAPGFYTVSLSITTWSGCQSTAVFIVYVGPSSPWGNPGVCQALFIPVPDSLGGNGLQFFDLSYSPFPILSWTWDFGDGTTSNEQNPYHVYSQPGNYTVTLAIEGDSCNSVVSFNINSLKPWDFNQKAANLGQSSVVTATHDLPVVSGLKLFPNPAVQDVQIAFNARTDDRAALRVLDMSGRLLHEIQTDIHSGANMLPLRVSQLVPGIYFLEIRDAAGVQTVKFVKQ
jgi:PKD repeat protein